VVVDINTKLANWLSSEDSLLGRLKVLVCWVDSAFYPPWDGKMSSNSFTWVTEGRDLGTADCGCLAGRCASLCLQAARGGHAAGGSG